MDPTERNIKEATHAVDRKGMSNMPQTTYQVILSTDGKYTVIVAGEDSGSSPQTVLRTTMSPSVCAGVGDVRLDTCFSECCSNVE